MKKDNWGGSNTKRITKSKIETLGEFYQETEIFGDFAKFNIGIPLQ